MPDPQKPLSLPQRLILGALAAPNFPRTLIEPELAPSHAEPLPSTVPAHAQQLPSVVPSHAYTGPTIGPPVGGGEMLPSFSEIMGSESGFSTHSPLAGVGRHAFAAMEDLNRMPAGEVAPGGEHYEAVGGMPGTPGDVKDVLALPGLYSRIERLLGKLPAKGAHPNKMLSLLRGGASSEEMAYRKIPEFLAAQGDTPVTPAAFEAHLAAHPAPFPEVTTLGSAPGRYDEFVGQMEARYGVGYDLGQLTPQERELQQALWAQAAGGGSQPPKYASHTLPGGGRYRETLLQLPTEMRKQGRYRVEIREPAPTPEGWSVRHVDENVSATDVERLRQRYQTPYDVHFEEIPTPVAGGFQSGHFDQPNVLAHVRHKERTLAAPPPPRPPLTRPDLAKEGYTVRVDREDPFSGRRQMTILDREGNFVGSRGMTSLTPEEYFHEHALERGIQDYNEKLTTPTGAKGRFLEEVQSDWHQRGKQQGYATPPDPAQLAALQPKLAEAQTAFNAATTAAVQAKEQLLASVNQATRPFLSPEYAHLRGFGQALGEGDQAVQVWRAARDRANALPEIRQLREAQQEADAVQQTAATYWTELQSQHRALTEPKGVPDAPFKETWPDLALKQQLLEVAGRPDLSWLGMTTGKTQADRYDLSKQISKLEYDPRDKRLIAYDHDGSVVISEFTDPTPEALEEYIGKEPAVALHKKITEQEASRAWEREQWSVEADPDDPNYFNVIDPNGEVVHDYGGDPERYSGMSGAERRRDELAESGMDTQRPTISGLDLQVGGEGMRHFYDDLLPARLRKLLKPFGGTVEQGRVSAVPTGAIPQGNPQLEEAAAWIARLTPEMKARILKEGFPLLTAIFGVDLGRRALADLADANRREDLSTPPPVRPPK